MTEFAPAVRVNAAIVLALAGPSGSGKTKSALELAVGLAGERGQILMLDSEGRRGLHYADDYKFFHHDWRPPYSPEALGKLLQEAERREFAVVIVDSMSDEHEGEGGLQDMAEAELQAQIKKGWDPNGASAWATPKAQHKLHVVRWLRQARIHVIFCLRAQERVRFEQFQDDRGKRRTKVVPIGWAPTCEKNLLYDVTTSLKFDPENPGVPRPIKLYDKHAPFFPSDRKVNRKAGHELAEWSRGGAVLLPALPYPQASPPTPSPLPLGETQTMYLRSEAEAFAGKGSDKFREWWALLNKGQKSSLRPFLRRYEGIAKEADESTNKETEEIII